MLFGAMADILSQRVRQRTQALNDAGLIAQGVTQLTDLLKRSVTPKPQ